MTYFAYLDEFGHIGPYVSRADPRYKDSPVFGLAGFVRPAAEVRGFGTWFFQRSAPAASGEGSSARTVGPSACARPSAMNCAHRFHDSEPLAALVLADSGVATKRKSGPRGLSVLRATIPAWSATRGQMRSSAAC